MEKRDFLRSRVFFLVISAQFILSATILSGISGRFFPSQSAEIPASGDIISEKSEIRALIERFSVDERSLNRYYFFTAVWSDRPRERRWL